MGGDGGGRTVGGWGRGRSGLAQLAWRASRGLTLATAGLTVLIGVLPAAFNVASGAVVGSVAAAATSGVRPPAGGQLTSALLVAGACYVLQQVLQPVRETVGTLLMGRIDERLIIRVMAATTAPPGIGHLEDPAVLDRVQQAQGAITGGTPGGAAYHASHVWGRRLMALASLAILASFRWWIAPLLVVGHAVGFAWRKRNWRTLNAVVMGKSEALRRSFYLRRLATEPAAAKEMRVFDLDRWLVERYRIHFLDTMGPIWRSRRFGGLIALAVSALAFALDVVVLLVIADAGLDGTIGVGAVVVYAGAVGAAGQLGIFSDNHQGFQDGMASLRVLEGLEAMSPTPSTPPASAAIDGAAVASAARSGCIRFEGVTFRYPGRDTAVLDGLDLEIEAGCSLAIVGENGAGKTTLVKLMARLYEPTGGRITIDGVDLRELDARQWQRQVAAIFQDFTRYQFSAYDNIAVGALHLARERVAVEHAAARAGATTIIEGLPGAWDTRLSRQFTGGADLSGGEWQRLALARALFAVAGGARVLVLDEPTAALDVRAEAEIYDRYLDLTRGVTTVLISHRFSTVRRADRIVVLDAGRVVEDGSHDQLLRARGLYAEMYELQARRFRTGDGDAGA